MNKTIITVQMLIKKPADVVYQAFINPEVTTNFWFTKSSGKLEKGKTINWQWEMYEASADVYVEQLTENQQIIIKWGDPQTTVEFNFNTLSANETYLVIKNYGFTQTGNELIQHVMDQTGGFTTVVDAAKAYLEFGINLNLVGDKFR
ncbi:SRPBCC family protein [Pedobacter montanisoli]|uniref:SRPBCC family protein n=1 Tax=Pedobacter montanisoli TaxID=2923277 RepID=A0ABS9ZZ33_9SPHI|nr:SRPBCC family protein [Pedobacter montanisoli]MCJ0743567.1 SRPBCC family protein [Pedobacter montanisoli]